jgi:uncharacterized paraquat-inducible protein A
MVALGVLLFLASPVLLLVLYGPTVRLVFLLSLPISVLAAASLAQLWAINRDRAEVRRAEYKLCLHCRYNLNGSPPAGACPECGQAYRHDHLERCWRWTSAQGSWTGRRTARRGDL